MQSKNTWILINIFQSISIKSASLIMRTGHSKRPREPKTHTNTHTHTCASFISSHSLHTQLTPELQLPKSHTHTHTQVMYAGHIWAAAEQKLWTLCGLIAGKIMSRGERRSHYCGARLSLSTPTLVQSDHYSIMSHYREKNKHHPSTWMYKHPPERRWTTHGAGELTSTLACYTTVYMYSFLPLLLFAMGFQDERVWKVLFVKLPTRDALTSCS